MGFSASRSRPGDLLDAHREEILALAELLGLENVRVFGSVARNEDGPGSDVDLLVHRSGAAAPYNVVEFALGAEDLLGVRVDVLVDSSPSVDVIALDAKAL